MAEAMVQRLGQVLYWAGCVLAALAVVAGLYALATGINGEGPIGLVFMLVVAAAAWAIGRACRFVLAGT